MSIYGYNRNIIYVPISEVPNESTPSMIHSTICNKKVLPLKIKIIKKKKEKLMMKKVIYILMKIMKLLL